MLTKATAKFIKSLQLKKYRKSEQSFVVEGTKSVLEVMSGDLEITHLLGTSDFVEKYADKYKGEIIEVSANQLSSIGLFKTNDGALAVVKQRPNKALYPNEELAIGLDGINDPGNLGTIIRIADWYGINKIIASENTVDLYNPKVIAASKGSFTRVRVFYTDLEKFLKNQSFPIYGAVMKGENIHNEKLQNAGFIILGNEANGISTEVYKLLNHKLTIPKYGNAESLNVAIATAIICDNFKRNQ